jgi:hypothetical protein
MARPKVQDLFDNIGKNGLLATHAEPHRPDPIAGFSKPALATTDPFNSFVLLAHADMRKGAYERCMPAVHAVCKYCKDNEPGTLAYDICKSAVEGDKESYVVEVYENSEYFLDPHMKTEPEPNIVERIGENAEFRDWLPDEGSWWFSGKKIAWSKHVKTRMCLSWDRHAWDPICW